VGAPDPIDQLLTTSISIAPVRAGSISMNLCESIFVAICGLSSAVIIWREGRL
jgi:hypothetical protein